MILSDRDVLRMLKSRDLEIEPFSEENLTPNGYDLSIGEIYIRKLDKHLKEGKVKFLLLRGSLLVQRNLSVLVVD